MYKLKIKHLKYSEIKDLRNKLLKRNKGKCPVLKIELEESKAVLDHIHKAKKTDDINKYSGVIRNTIHSGANCFIGKVENAFKRFIPKDTITLPELLRNVANYIEFGGYVDNNTIFSHPSENFGGDMIKMKQIPFSKKLYKELESKCKEAKIKTPKYKPFLDSKLYSLLQKFSLI